MQINRYFKNRNMKSHFFWWSSSLLRSDIMSPLHLWITGTIIPHNTIQYNITNIQYIHSFIIIVLRNVLFSDQIATAHSCVSIKM